MLKEAKTKKKAVKSEYHNDLATVLGRMGRSIEALGASEPAIEDCVALRNVYIGGQRGLSKNLT
jgi:hypothetical protein